MGAQETDCCYLI